MTGPVTTKALVEFQRRNGYHRREIEELLTEFGELVLATAETSLQQVTAERDEGRAKLRSACLDALAAQDQAAENDERARAAEASLATATSELARLRAEGEAKDRALKILLPFVDYAAGEGLMFRGSDDTDRPDMDAADLCTAAAAALGFELGDPGYCALVEQGEQEITALARAATAREGA